MSQRVLQETKGADTSVPLALLTSVLISVVGGYLHVMTLLFSIQARALLMLQPDADAALPVLRAASAAVAAHRSCQWQLLLLACPAGTTVCWTSAAADLVRGMQKADTLFTGSAGGNVVAQIYVDIFEARQGARTAGRAHTQRSPGARGRLCAGSAAALARSSAWPST